MPFMFLRYERQLLFSVMACFQSSTIYGFEEGGLWVRYVAPQFKGESLDVHIQAVMQD